jgi:hypothetical protein
MLNDHLNKLVITLRELPSELRGLSVNDRWCTVLIPVGTILTVRACEHGPDGVFVKTLSGPEREVCYYYRIDGMGLILGTDFRYVGYEPPEYHL